jgi:hypothetical protein
LALHSIGVLLVTRRSALLSGIVSRIVADAPALALLDEVTGEDPIDADLERTGAQAIVWLGDDLGRQQASAILKRHRDMQIVTVEADGRDGSVWRMVPSRERLGALSPARLVAALFDQGDELRDD